MKIHVIPLKHYHSGKSQHKHFLKLPAQTLWDVDNEVQQLTSLSLFQSSGTFIIALFISFIKNSLWHFST